MFRDVSEIQIVHVPFTVSYDILNNMLLMRLEGSSIAISLIGFQSG